MTTLTVSGYKITTEPKPGKYPAELAKQMTELTLQSRDRKNKTIIPRLERLIKKYPEVPVLKNFLMTAYTVKDMHKKAEAINIQLFKEHPDYLFAKLNEANRLIHANEFEKVPDLLGKAMDIKGLYPERDEFHISEVIGFLVTAIRYFALKQDLDQAEPRLEILKELDPFGKRTRELDEQVTALRMLKNIERLQESYKERISPVRAEKPLPQQTTQPPKLNHPEVAWLYKYDLKLPEEKLQQILALPRQTLSADLVAVLEDGLNRFDYFKNGEAPEEGRFLQHALFLLGEIKATHALPDIIRFLEYDQELLEFWLGDHLFESLWRIFYQLGESNPEAFQDILLNPQVNTYAKSQAANGLIQLALHQPEKKEAVIGILRNVFQIMIRASKADNVIDTEFIGLACWLATDAGFKELLPEIKQLYEKKYLSPLIMGTFPEIEEIFQAGPDENFKKEILPLPQFYRHVVSTWFSYQEIPASPVKLEPKGKPALSQTTKAGRNDPCPCGSGKKFKKCCGS